MSRLSTGVLVALVVMGLALLAPFAAQAGTEIRPIKEFLDVQGTYLGAPAFTPPVPNQIGWSSPIPPPPATIPKGWVNQYTNRFAMVDYAGLANKYLMSQSYPDLGTTFEGTVMIRDLANDPDTVEVTVVLHTKNALTWVAEFTGWPGDNNFANLPLLFGARVDDILGTNGRAKLKPALGESFLHVVFKNPKGAALPDLMELNWARFPDFVFMRFLGQADGQLRAAFDVPDGTPGRAKITQAGLIDNYFNNPVNKSRVKFDGFPAERVDLKVVGK
jgi:hypothetical protein